MRGTTVERVLLVAAAVACVPFAARADERTEKLGKGEIFVDTAAVAGSDVPRLILTGVVDAPPAEVWPIIEQCARYKEFMPRTVESEELSRDGNVIRCRTKIDFPWPMDDLGAVTRAEHTVTDGKWERRWTLESGDYHRIEGSWVLTPFEGDPNRTRAEYRMFAVPKSGIPGFIRDAAQKNAIPDVMRALRSQVQKRRAAAGK